MIKLTYAKITHPGFQGALSKLYAQSLPTKTAFDLRTLTKRVEKELANADRARFDVLDKHAVKDENGMFVPQKDQDGKVVPGSVTPMEGKEEEFRKDFVAYLGTEIEVMGHKFNADSFEGANLSAQDIDLLEDILDI